MGVQYLMLLTTVKRKYTGSKSFHREIGMLGVEPIAWDYF
jgi:hypothetical protein